MDGIKILYNHTDAFFPQPVPFVGLTEANLYFGELWGKEETLTMNGQLTGCTFADIAAAQQNLVEKFKMNYQSLEIWQEQSGISGKIFQKDLTQITAIEFDTAKWLGVLPYTITLTCYPSGYFSGVFGVLDPVDTWDLSESQNYTSQVVHTVSCRGFNTSNSASNAVDNAKNWALNRRGTTSFIPAAFIENLSLGNLCLVTSAEQIDRFNGTYSITDTYTSDLTRTGYGIMRYAVACDSGDNKITVSLNGSVQGCGQNLAGIRQSYQSLDKTATAALMYQKLFHRTDLNPTPLAFNVEEDAYNALLSFSFSYDNDNAPDTHFDYTVTLNSGNAITASINGTVISRGTDLRNKLIISKNFAKTINLYNLVVPFFNNFYSNYALYPLSPWPTSSGISINESQGTVQLNAEFTNQATVSDFLDSFEYTLNFNPSLPQLDAQARLNGSGIFSIVDLGYVNRAALSINGTSQININVLQSDGIASIKSKCMQLLSQYGRTDQCALEENELSTEHADNRRVSFNVSWSFDSPIKITLDYVTIDNLSL